MNVIFYCLLRHRKIVPPGERSLLRGDGQTINNGVTVVISTQCVFEKGHQLTSPIGLHCAAKTLPL